jgi:hypothetical protein
MNSPPRPRMRRSRFLPLLPLLLLLVAGAGHLTCSPTTDGTCACTEEFRTFAVTVLDDAMQPAEDVVLTRTNLRTGRVIEPGWLGMLTPGTYLVADDSNLDEFSSRGDIVRVVGGGPAGSFSADFVFRVPEPCRCHVELVAGPDTVVIGEPLPAD